MDDAVFDYLIRRGRTLTPEHAPLDPLLGGDLVGLWNVVGELAHRLGYEPAKQEGTPFDESLERKRMGELRSEIEGLKSGKA